MSLPHDHVLHDVVLDADAELVWELLTRPDEQAAWLGAEVDLDATPGARGRVVDHDGTVRHLVVEEVEAGALLRWRWSIDGDEELTSQVEITIEAGPDRTHLRVVETPLPSPTMAVRASATWASRLVDLEVLVLFAAAAIRA
jgi:uncharacterized protein YndB with AHSA1/START domain